MLWRYYLRVPDPLYRVEGSSRDCRQSRDTRPVAEVFIIIIRSRHCDAKVTVLHRHITIVIAIVLGLIRPSTVVMPH